MEVKYFVLGGGVTLYIVVVYFFSRLGKTREIGTRRLFLLSLFLTPVMGLAFYFSSQERKVHPYTEMNYKCNQCGYVFSDHHQYCPFCAKEGHKHKLKRIAKYMT